ncbi:MAG: hypothetical protein IJH51_00560 [Christensenellaceae bacterium]|nr:hypothetical protein [Christensenellaceae bacterium]
MTDRIKLGPLAIFIVIVAIIMTVLALLTFATARADYATAEKYADVTQIKYELDRMGSEYMMDLDSTLKNGGSIMLMDGAERQGRDLYRHVESIGDYELTIDFSVKGGSYEIKRWKITRVWQEDDSMGNLWHRP